MLISCIFDIAARVIYAREPRIAAVQAWHRFGVGDVAGASYSGPMLPESIDMIVGRSATEAPNTIERLAERDVAKITATLRKADL